jgi:very-short-patch-repair endonuclease
MPLVHNHEKLKERRRELRKRSTKTEEILWSKIRNNQLGYKFKRQHSIGGYILDFYCSEHKLIIELDGATHNTKEAKEYDKIRDKYFSELGYKTFRFQNEEVNNEIEKVLKIIRGDLISPSPLQGEGQG